VRAVRPTGETFDLAAAGSVAGGALFNPRPSDRRVTLLLNADAAWVPESYPVESVEQMPDGKLTVVLVANERAWLERLLLRLGPSAEVLDPAEVRVEAAEAARRLLARYG
jgi:proteasome accessory factor C